MFAVLQTNDVAYTLLNNGRFFIKAARRRLYAGLYVLQFYWSPFFLFWHVPDGQEMPREK